jgi:hypothetical protein
MGEENVTLPVEVLTTQEAEYDWDNHVGDNITF